MKNNNNNSLESHSSPMSRERQIFSEHYTKILRWTDRLFISLLFVEWLAAIACAVWISPKTWIGSESSIHIHVYFAVFGGGLIAAVPMALAMARPASVVTRHCIAAAQMFYSGLFIHLMGGRVETHFHVFGSLAFLSFYRDWTVLITASGVTAADHFLRGFFYPQSVYGIVNAGDWRWLEHAGWVIFEDCFLIYACCKSKFEMREIAVRRAELEHTNETIENVVKQRTKELEEARDEAFQAAKVKAEFLATMSHELRTPLNGILGVTSLLLDTKLDVEQKEFTNTVRGCSTALLSLITDILDFSKLDAQKLELERIPIDTRSLIFETMEIVACQADRKQIDLCAKIAPNVPARFEGDPQRLRQILLNLLSNAIKFTEKGYISIELERLDASDGLLLQFSMTDTGIGIPPERVERLFKAFSQVDASTTRKYGGTGLGLVICRKLVEAMGGQITVESEVGKGTKFIFQIRSVEVPGEATKDSSVSVLLASDGSPEVSRLRSRVESWGWICSEASRNDVPAILAADATKKHDVVVVPYFGDDNDLFKAEESLAAAASEHRAASVLLGRDLNYKVAAKAKASGFAGYFTIQDDDHYLKFVLSSAKVVRTRAALPSPSAAKKDGVEAGRPKALVAEDNSVNQIVACRILQKAGFDVTVAGNGKIAVEAFTKNHFDIIFMDCQMPELDGFEASREIRKIEDGKLRTPIIALTANALDGDRDACLAAGMDDYLSKPVQPERLIDTARRWAGVVA